MKTTVYLILLTFSTSVSSQSFDSAIDYLDFVGEQQEAIVKKMWNYTKAIAHGRSDRSIENKRKNLVKTVDRAISNVKKAEGYDGVKFKNQIIKSLEFNRNLLNSDYAKIIDLKAVAEQSYDAMEAYFLAQQMADEKMEQIQEEYEANLYVFAHQNNIQLVESESDLSKKMRISNEVFKYYKDLNLEYYKVYFNEVYLMDALNRGDIGAIEQSASALSESASLGLESLDTVTAFKNDKSVIAATRKTFEFFKNEGETEVQTLLDFLILKEEFEKITETLENTPQRKRTKEQIDNYNKKVKEFNKGIERYNATNNKLNQQRQTAINNLNNTNQQFLARHVPND